MTAPVDAWRRHAACRGRDPRLWFPARGDRTTATLAQSVCARCGVRVACLNDALQTELASESFGIRGGLNADERSGLPRHRVEPIDANHNTPVGAPDGHVPWRRRRSVPTEPPLQGWTRLELLEVRGRTV